MRLPSRERRLARTRWVEAGVSVLGGVGTVGVLLRPSLLPLFLAVFFPLSLGLTVWQYRVMDEFRRVRLLKAWAAAGAAGLLALTGLIVWVAASSSGFAGPPETTPALPLSLWALYVPWGLVLATFFGVTAYLYRRDTGS